MADRGEQASRLSRTASRRVPEHRLSRSIGFFQAIGYRKGTVFRVGGDGAPARLTVLTVLTVLHVLPVLPVLLPGLGGCSGTGWDTRRDRRDACSPRSGGGCLSWEHRFIPRSIRIYFLDRPAGLFPSFHDFSPTPHDSSTRFTYRWHG
ncbi:MAG: hypothetical protein JWL81_1677 [Verrucomicrobiales bacterium]|nr:hypothetical protein [Verrucomicrobiales bacterium]